jgi:ABC-type spermidine/putrescine transport system permease subunit II
MDSQLRMRLWRWLLTSFTCLALFYLVAPTLVVVPLSFSSSLYMSFPPPGWSTQWYVKLWHTPVYAHALGNSVLIGLASTAIAMVFGTMLALALVRGRFRGAQLLSAVVLAPFLLPHIILALGLYSVLAPFGLAGSYTGVILGHAVVATPLVFITVAAALRSYDHSFEMAAMTLGANNWKTFWLVTFPMIRLGVFAGAIIGFSFSFDEIILSLFLTNPQTATLPKELYSELRYDLKPTVAAASTVIILISMVLLTSAALLQKKAARDGMERQQ